MQSTTTAAHERRRGGAAAPAPPGRESEALFGARWRDGAEALRREDPWPAPGPMHEALGDNAVSEVSRRRAHGVDHHFSCVLDRWPVTNQRRTGRCWIFAATAVTALPTTVKRICASREARIVAAAAGAAAVVVAAPKMPTTKRAAPARPTAALPTPSTVQKTIGNERNEAAASI